MSSKKRRICSRCAMPESPPYLWLDDQGVCRGCHEQERNSSGSVCFPDADTFNRLIQQQLSKKKSRYDCLVPCSGGRGSTTALYIIKKQYKLEPLVLMYDNGFEPDQAVANVHSAADRLGVDLVYHKSAYMQDLFREVLVKDAPVFICHLCSIWHMRLMCEYACRWDINLVITGWTRGQSLPPGQVRRGSGDLPEYEAMARSTREFVGHMRSFDKYSDFPLSVSEAEMPVLKDYDLLRLSPFWYLDVDEKAMSRILKQELGWKPVRGSYSHGSTNCLLNQLSAARSLKYHGFTHYHIECSRLIRQGLMTREAALDKLKFNTSKARLKKIADKLL